MFVRTAVFAFLCLIFISPSSVRAETQFMELDEVRELVKNGTGLPAYFETVTEGMGKQRFNILIEGIYDMTGTTAIMFKSMHYIAAGMSGSPTYAIGKDGKKKFVGAVAYSFGRHPVGVKWGGISPGVKMREESRGFEVAFQKAMSGNSKNTINSGYFRYKGMDFKPIPLGTQSVPNIFVASLGKTLSELGFDKNTGFVVTTRTAGQATGKSKKPVQLEAGMPIVADLLEWTDEKGNTSSLGAMGTISYVGPQGQVYAFGHPFLGAGAVMYQFRTCKVIGTLWSSEKSFKLQGEPSDVLGFIGMDGRYGIYGFKTDKNKLIPERFQVSFEWQGQEGKPTKYQVAIARTPIMPTLVSASFSLLGEMYGVPGQEQASITEIKALVSLSQDKVVLFDNIFTSSSVPFGPDIIRKSSYEHAYEGFLGGVYNRFNNAPFGISIEGFSVALRFTHGSQKVLHVAGSNFPNKVVFGTTPEVEVLLVSEDNSIAVSRKIPMQIDWSKIETPSYNVNTKDTEKKPEKVVRGAMNLYTSQFVGKYLTDQERARDYPAYYLNADEYMQSSIKGLTLTNKKLFAKTMVRRKSGLFDKTGQDTNISVEGESAVKDGWTVYSNGLSSRPVIVKDMPFIPFETELEAVPGGYMLAPFDTTLQYEVVLAEPSN